MRGHGRRESAPTAPKHDTRVAEAGQASRLRRLPGNASTNILLSIILTSMAAKPMTGQAFFVLTALADGPRHGYGIVGEVADLSQGRVNLKIGSLYGVLERLAAEGLIEPDREEAHDGRLRRYYRLTEDGRRALAEEAELRAATARVVRARLRLAGTEAAG
jgi:DNA-binding PadR family transcriptional regulator